MKMQPEIETSIMYNDHCHADCRGVYPALQTCQVDITAADNRHDHILRAALLASGGAFPAPCRQ